MIANLDPPAQAASAAGPRAKIRTFDPSSLPTISPFLVRWFCWYAVRYLGKHFHSLRVSRSSAAEPNPAGPLVIYVNHASWWDPLVGAALARTFFSRRRVYTPIAAEALQRYKMFRQLGFFGVEPDSSRAAIRFLRTATNVLQQPDGLLWVTPQGRFADARERPAGLRPGLGHLATRVQATFLPLAIEYVFWEERTPEILVRFGRPLRSDLRRSASPADWTRRFEAELTLTQDALAAEAISHNPAAFERLLHGRTGIGGPYDWWRRAAAAWRGETFDQAHGRK